MPVSQINFFVPSGEHVVYKYKNRIIDLSLFWREASSHSLCLGTLTKLTKTIASSVHSNVLDALRLKEYRQDGLLISCINIKKIKIQCSFKTATPATALHIPIGPTVVHSPTCGSKYSTLFRYDTPSCPPSAYRHPFTTPTPCPLRHTLMGATKAHLSSAG